MGAADTVWGYVKRVVDGDTFLVRITERSPSNRGRYAATETMRIADRAPDERPGRSAVSAKVRLEERLLNQPVKLVVRARDSEGRALCAVEAPHPAALRRILEARVVDQLLPPQ